MNMQALALKVAEQRKKLQLSQSELAKRVGVSRNYISVIERAKLDNISFKVLANLAAALELPFEDLNKTIQQAGPELLSTFISPSVIERRQLSTNPAAVKARRYREKKRLYEEFRQQDIKQLQETKSSSNEEISATEYAKTMFSSYAAPTLAEIAEQIEKIAAKRSVIAEDVLSSLYKVTLEVYHSLSEGDTQLPELTLKRLKYQLEKAEEFFNSLEKNQG